MIAAGQRRHRVELANPPAVRPDADGGYSDAYVPLDPSSVFAQLAPVSDRDQERAAAGSVLATASHTITIPWHAGVTIETRVTFTDYRAGRSRVFQVTAVRDPDETGRELVLAAEERL